MSTLPDEIARLRICLHPVTQAVRQRFRGEDWVLLRNPLTNRFARLRPDAYAFFSALDARESIERYIASSGASAPDDAASLVMFLDAGGFLWSPHPGDAGELLSRARERRRAQRIGVLMNIVFLRVHLFSPDRLVSTITPALRWAFTKLGLALWCVLLLAGVGAVLGNIDDAGASVQAFRNAPPAFWALLAAAFVLTKLAHEAGHAVACKVFGRDAPGGAEVRSFGIFFLVFFPLPYIDVTDAWMIPGKWRRAAVSAAGVYLELGLAAIAAVVWSTTAPGTIHTLSFQVMLIASVSTLLFNANPLLRFDGYYILADLTETPNLDTRSRRYAAHLVKRHLFGIESTDPSATPGEGALLGAYWICARVYRLFIAAVIIWFVSGQFLIIGTTIALLAITAWFVLPLARTIAYLARHPELESVRGRAIGVSAVAATIPIAFVTLVPLPHRAAVLGITEPERIAIVHGSDPGFVVEIAPNGTSVAPGDALAVLENDMLSVSFVEHRARRDEARVREAGARAFDPALADTWRERGDAHDAYAARAGERSERLRIEAPIAGVWISNEGDRLIGTRRSPRDTEPLGIVADMDSLVVRAAGDQRVGPLIASRVEPGDSVRLRSASGDVTEGVVRSIAPIGARELRSEALSAASGGSIMRTEPGTAAEPYFEIVIDAPEGTPELIGRRVRAEFTLGRRPLASGWLDQLRRLFQKRFSV